MKTFAMILMTVLLAGAPGAWAQSKKADEQNRSVQGVVTAPDESPVVGAVVQLKNVKSLQIRSFVTQENGTYYFHGLSPDVDYELSATCCQTGQSAAHQGSASGTKTLSSFDSRKQATINLKLNPKK